MATTTLGDLFATNATAAYAVVTSFMDRDPVSRTPFAQSGLLVTDPLVQQAAASNTNIVELPFWRDLDASVEPNYSNDVYEDIAVPQKIGTGSLKARNAWLNEAWGVMTLAQALAADDPWARIAARLDTFWARQAERRVVATVRGIYADNVAANGGDMVHDSATVDEAALIDAILTMGDAFGEITGYITHSAVFGAFLRNQMAEARRTEDGVLQRTMMGLPVEINDSAATTPDGTKHLTVLMGPGAFAYGMTAPGNVVARGYEQSYSLEYDREAARGNGGGSDTLWSRRNMIVHPLGYDFTSASITGNGTETTPRSAGWADLANPANWTRVADRKQVPIAFLTTPKA